MENNNNKIIYIFLAIAVVMFLTVGGTLAYLTWSSNTTQQTAVSFTTTAGLSCSADGGGNITSSNTQLAPATCTDTEHAIQRTITTSLTNSNQGSAYMSLSLKVNSMASELAASENFKYALTTSPTSCTTGVKESGTFTGATTNSTFTILDSEEFATSGSGTYYLYIWLDEAETNNNTQNKAFSLSLTGICANRVAATIGDILSSSAVMDNTSSDFVSALTGISFSAISSDTNGKGLYIRAGTENDLYPIYYYRGAVTNNNVLFGSFCWKIVRTTNTGGTKLIYNGIPTGENSDQCENTTGIATQLATKYKFNAKYASPADVGYMYGTRYISQSKDMQQVTDAYMYGTGYDETNHELVTTNAKYLTGTQWANLFDTINYNHYTCFNTSGQCDQVYYVHGAYSSSAEYMTIPSGKTISQMLEEMVTNSSNTTNSTIKTAIDTWYATNMTSYTDKLEDTPYCSDRTIYTLGSWNPNGGIVTRALIFAPYKMYSLPSSTSPPLLCNINDAFTVNAGNGNGKLTYPVGLLTLAEVYLAGGGSSSNSSYYLYTGQRYWTISPAYFNNVAHNYIVSSNGDISDVYVNDSTRGVRPVVSLKAGVKFATGGDGTPTNPYVVE